MGIEESEDCPLEILTRWRSRSHSRDSAQSNPNFQVRFSFFISTQRHFEFLNMFPSEQSTALTLSRLQSLPSEYNASFPMYFVSASEGEEFVTWRRGALEERSEAKKREEEKAVVNASLVCRPAIHERSGRGRFYGDFWYRAAVLTGEGEGGEASAGTDEGCEQQIKLGAHFFFRRSGCWREKTKRCGRKTMSSLLLNCRWKLEFGDVKGEHFGTKNFSLNLAKNSDLSITKFQKRTKRSSKYFLKLLQNEED